MSYLFSWSLHYYNQKICFNGKGLVLPSQIVSLSFLCDNFLNPWYLIDLLPSFFIFLYFFQRYVKYFERISISNSFKCFYIFLTKKLKWYNGQCWALELRKLLTIYWSSDFGLLTSFFIRFDVHNLFFEMFSLSTWCFLSLITNKNHNCGHSSTDGS